MVATGKKRGVQKQPICRKATETERRWSEQQLYPTIGKMDGMRVASKEQKSGISEKSTCAADAGKRSRSREMRSNWGSCESDAGDRSRSIRR